MMSAPPSLKGQRVRPIVQRLAEARVLSGVVPQQPSCDGSTRLQQRASRGRWTSPLSGEEGGLNPFAHSQQA